MIDLDEIEKRIAALPTDPKGWRLECGFNKWTADKRNSWTVWDGTGTAVVHNELREYAEFVFHAAQDIPELIRLAREGQRPESAK